MKMKKLLKNAVVYAVAASMLFATPLTASAGLIDAYKVTDGSGNDAPGSDENEPTGTVTNTATNSDTLPLRNNDAHIIGVVLDQDYVTVEKGKKATLKATVVIDGDETLPSGLVDQLNALIRWETSELQTVSIDADAADRSTVSLYARRGTKLGEEVKITASIGGNFVYDCTVDGKDYHVTTSTTPYTATAKVYVKEYTESFELKNPGEQFVKHTLDVNTLLQNREPATANDTFTWSIDTTNVKNSATLSAAGIITFKKANPVTKDEKTGVETGGVVVTAVSERGVTREVRISVADGVQSTKVEIHEVKDGEDTGKVTTTSTDFANDNTNITVKAVMSGKAADNKEKNKVLVEGEKYTDNNDKEQTFAVTDVVTWTSNKTDILTVQPNVADGGRTATLKPVKAGTAKVTAKTSSGKSATLTVTVKATLTRIEIDKINVSTLYTGQSVQLTAKRYSGNKDVTNQSTEALQWTIVKVPKKPNDPANTQTKANPNASINSSKGILTIKNKIDKSYLKSDETTPYVYVQVKAKTSGVISAETACRIEVAQSSIENITVEYFDDANKKTAIAAKAVATPKVTSTVKLSAEKNKVFTAKVEQPTPAEGAEKLLTWKSSSAKVATVEPNGDGTAKIKAVGKGTATITVSGLKATTKSNGTVNVSTIKATFKVSVTQPVTSLTMNKPSVVLKNTGKAQNVSLSVKANKNAKAKVTWKLVQTKGNSPKVTVDSKGKVTLPRDEYSPGDEFVVTATDVTGVKATSTIKVVSTSAGASAWRLDATGVDNSKNTFSYIAPKGKNGTKTVTNATVLGLGGKVTLKPMVNVGKANAPIWAEAGKPETVTTSETSSVTYVAAGVTYAANKKGVVDIQINEDGTATVTRLKAGSVKITVKTEDGKSYKLTIDDKSKEYVAPQPDASEK